MYSIVCLTTSFRAQCRVIPSIRAFMGSFSSSASSTRDTTPAAGKTVSKKGAKFFISKEDFSLISTYKAVCGDLWIASQFKIPKKAPWPESVYGYELGKVASKIRKHYRSKTLAIVSQKKLETMGFPWKFRKYSDEEILLAFNTYKEMYGDLYVKWSFIVPQSPEWPVSTWTMKLGLIADGLRNRKGRSEQVREQLKILGFDFSNQTKTTSFDKLKEALVTYKQLYGDLIIPCRYCIEESDERYAQELWGMPLGKIIHSIRSIGTRAKHKEELIAMGFQYENLKRPANYEEVKEALTIYKQYYGHLHIPCNYVISKDDCRFPPHLHEMRLGNAVSKIRIANAYSRHRKELEEMGFSYQKKMKIHKFEEVREALLTYKKIHGHLVMRREYVIPGADHRYPKNLWGMKLGQVARNIRVMGTYRKHKEELIAIGMLFPMKYSSEQNSDDVQASQQ
jgi:hypothetical protein